MFFGPLVTERCRGWRGGHGVGVLEDIRVGERHGGASVSKDVIRLGWNRNDDLVGAGEAVVGTRKLYDITAAQHSDEEVELFLNLKRAIVKDNTASVRGKKAETIRGTASATVAVEAPGGLIAEAALEAILSGIAHAENGDTIVLGEVLQLIKVGGAAGFHSQ